MARLLEGLFGGEAPHVTALYYCGHPWPTLTTTRQQTFFPPEQNRSPPDRVSQVRYSSRSNPLPVEHLPVEFLDGTVLEAGGERVDGTGI
jgi:hypothetical protein